MQKTGSEISDGDGEDDDDDTLIEDNGPLRIGRRVYFFGWRKCN